VNLVPLQEKIFDTGYTKMLLQSGNLPVIHGEYFLGWEEFFLLLFVSINVLMPVRFLQQGNIL